MNICVADNGLYLEDENGKEYAAEFEELIDAYIKTDKYRWHDLRKNPEDLPEEDTYVIVWDSGEPIMAKNEHWINYFGELKVKWIDDTNCFLRNVIAWKYIESFKEE